jgi:uncharacterized protein
MKRYVRCGQTLSAIRWVYYQENGQENGLIRLFSHTTPTMYSITFTQFDQALTTVQSPIGAGEAHGCLCGALCGSKKFKVRNWMDELLPDDINREIESVRALESLLQSIYTDTHRAIRGNEMDFEPFLLDDESPLAARTQAMAQWCQGFLYGFGIGGGQSTRTTSNEVTEVLSDLARVARASVGDSEPTEEDESDYTEIIEYIRAGVQLIHDELHAPQVTQAPGGSSDRLQ